MNSDSGKNYVGRALNSNESSSTGSVVLFSGVEGRHEG